ncbi:hypothetical protein [Pedobacter sp. SYSU D00535]|uniref:hypothetical protein n=1 Tax=Pedobacter sp. SYSU D00535 TaxID=2810308 RepID=UPI001A97A73C|nr:hypothetical protein [Pedobacter sp. SYSU D00535]
MYTKTIIPKTKSITIDLPDEFVGEQVRLIMVIEKETGYHEVEDKKVDKLREAYSKYKRQDLSGFTFNRDEANDFE